MITTTGPGDDITPMPTPTPKPTSPAVWSWLTTGSRTEPVPGGELTYTYRRLSGRLISATVRPEGMPEVHYLPRVTYGQLQFLRFATTPVGLALRARWVAKDLETRRLAEEFAGVTT